jgi:hypothetical protein
MNGTGCLISGDWDVFRLILRLLIVGLCLLTLRGELPVVDFCNLFDVHS